MQQKLSLPISFPNTTSMYSFQYTMHSNSFPNFDENRWIINIRRTLEEELENDTETPVCIFSVPKTLLTSDPHSYTPQLVAMGPYHHWRPELYEIEGYKIAAAKRIQKQLGQELQFQDVVNELINLDPKIRSCYHKLLDLSNEALAWMMAIDGSFLLEFLQVYDTKRGVPITGLPSRMSHLVDYAGRKSAHNAILKDIVMLENQIPLFVLRKMLELQFSSLDTADHRLNSMLVGLSKEISPFKMVRDVPQVQVSQCAHLLDYMYDTIVPKVEAPSQTAKAAQNQTDDTNSGKEGYCGDPSYVRDLFSLIWKLISKLDVSPVRLVKSVLSSGPVRVIIKLPWTIISKLPGSAIPRRLVYFFFSQNNQETQSDSSNNESCRKPPLIEEIAIPSVTELSKSGVHFASTNGNISTISFDVKSVTFYLPIINLDISTEVVLRNMIAYEASSSSGPLIFARYTELMNGIIDTAEDVKLLRQKGIILNHMRSDEEVSNLWNGMSKSIRLTKVPFLDKVIEDVNKHYNNRWQVKIGRFMKIYVFTSWQCLTFLCAIFLVLLMSFQAFCSVYNCSRVFRISTISSAINTEHPF